jgi:hypothetical protein
MTAKISVVFSYATMDLSARNGHKNNKQHSASEKYVLYL